MSFFLFTCVRVITFFKTHTHTHTHISWRDEMHATPWSQFNMRSKREIPNQHIALFRAAKQWNTPLCLSLPPSLSPYITGHPILLSGGKGGSIGRCVFVGRLVSQHRWHAMRRSPPSDFVDLSPSHVLRASFPPYDSLSPSHVLRASFPPYDSLSLKRTTRTPTTLSPGPCSPQSARTHHTIVHCTAHYQRPEERRVDDDRNGLRLN